jgi:hypothetical protein
MRRQPEQRVRCSTSIRESLAPMGRLLPYVRDVPTADVLAESDIASYPVAISTDYSELAFLRFQLALELVEKAPIGAF